ncbi:MAG: B12-binding domain-containing radical SAM protein [Thermoguttaceae bacterium]
MRFAVAALYNGDRSLLRSGKRAMPPADLQSSPSSNRPPTGGGPIRVLLATAGWPSGILEIGSWAARQAGAQVVILQVPAGRAETLVERLESWRPHVVGFRVEGEPFEPLVDWISLVRRFSSAEVVLGGPTATSHPMDLLQWSGADYVFAGEAEESFALFLQFARRPDSRDLLPAIPGAAYRYGGRVFHNTLPADGYGRSVVEAGSTGSPASTRCLRHAVRPIAFQEVLTANRLDWSLLDGFETPFDSLYFTGGRGCPGVCTFCARLHGQQVRTKSAGQLLEEIERADACVAEGRLKVTRWPLFAHVDDDGLRPLEVSWAAVYDEDFFLHIPRAIEFFDLWSRSPLRRRYRLSLQTNPCSLLARRDSWPVSSATDEASGSTILAVRERVAGKLAILGPYSAHPELIRWIDRVKPMVQLGAESFNPALLARWHKRHNLAQLECVLDALDSTRQDYTVFQLLTDFDTTAAELIETLRLLILAGLTHPRMRIASSPYTIPLYDSDTRRSLELAGRLPPGHVGDFRDYERAHPEWMDPLVADLADLADERLHWTLNPQTRGGALSETMPAVVEHLRQLRPAGCPRRDELLAQAQAAADEIAGARFQFHR